jgi:RHS repeat-associated protein
VVQEIAYDAFGGVTQDTNPGFQPFYFAGGLYDEDTGLVHFGEREYDARLGRFTSVDPIGFGGGQLNLHAYVMGDPVNVIDPTGLDWVNDLGQGGMCFGDSVTFGISAKVRNWLGMGGIKDECSDACKAGELGAAALPWPGGKLRLLQNARKGLQGGRKIPWAGHVPYAPKRDLPTYPKSGRPKPESPYPHTQVGTRKGQYPQSREFDGEGRPVRDIDWTDHGDPRRHTNPHQHVRGPDGSRGGPEPLWP